MISRVKNWHKLTHALRDWSYSWCYSLYVTFVFNVQCSDGLQLRAGKNFPGSKLRINVYEAFLKCLYLSDSMLFAKKKFIWFQIMYIVASSDQNIYILWLYRFTLKTRVDSTQVAVICFIHAPSVLRFIQPLHFLLTLVVLSICLKLLE